MKNTITRLAIVCLTLLCSFSGFAQNRTFTRQDTLRGSITPGRAWWDLTYYHLSVQVNPADSTIQGMNTIQYKVLEPKQVMQIDMQQPMAIEKVVQDGKSLQFKRDGNTYFVQLAANQKPGSVKQVDVYFGGKPTVSTNPPWSGGITWKKDSKGNPFIANSNQGSGASMWWPCKDHMYDEPDSMLISVRVPENLMDVSNGRLRKVEQHKDRTKTYHWFVDNPINNYGVNLSIADYAHFSEKYQGEKGVLDCNYYVLKGNLEKAKVQFKDAGRMLQAFEHWFGPYPFYEDGYKLVEVPYLGMEHQSAVTYGNGYENGYRGRDLSGSGWGLKFDFIIIHESGHEWFANNITNKDVADMWIHESFTNYSENLFLDYHYGKQASSEYVIGTRQNIKNDRPIIGVYGVNRSGSGDMYYKGGNMLHTLRQIVNNDEKWRGILRGLNQDFYHQTVTTQQIEDYLSQHVGRDLKPFFDQYLRDVRIPKLEYQVSGKKLNYRWSNVVPGFDMPVKVLVNGKEQWLEPTAEWKELKTRKKNAVVKVSPDFYIETAITER
ncbi:M1 family metallopeptidase [Pontibacter sp. BT310]|uniref:M1 family metallopeptidase n=1 Tax=Pontibacter populi TaxID=890055 RepID=A0ABS6XAK2_9BACT|nr:MULTISPECIES: M1 family metallopeptidase [Pontibacter]MBJ6118167.1 M1 family metallopeptidase [Pontibacter sp. BT310]MBR0570594.1 M1 family metallopeptidase [Microvirga sp. STS03]MBW3365020.1 M1 family metallopeptidase [Pontibacter populi]